MNSLIRWGAMTDLELARKANDRALTIQAAALACAQILERLASPRPLHVAQKMRREGADLQGIVQGGGLVSASLGTGWA